MVNTLSANKEKEIMEINKFYNDTVQAHSKLLNQVETDQKSMIDNYESKLSEYLCKNVEIYREMEKQKNLSEELTAENEHNIKTFNTKLEQAEYEINNKINQIKD